jgi:hypothetical protein
MMRQRFPLIAVAGAVMLLIASGVGRAHQGGPSGPLGGDVSFADPAVAGLSYEWTVRMDRRHKVQLIFAVGAKSWNEPSNPEGEKGWTHTSNWIALELAQPAVLKITVERQQGVVVVSGTTAAVARFALVPAVSLYEGWDETTASETHTFNNVGNFWSTVVYRGSNSNEKGKPRVRYSVRLPAGRYSIVVGGNPRSLGDASAYPANDCDPVDPTCYAYTGLQGYKVTLQTK